MGHAGKTVTAVVQGCPVGCIDQLDEGYLSRWMATSLVACVARMTTAEVPTSEIFVRLTVGDWIKSFRYPCLGVVEMWWATATRTAKTLFLGWLRINGIFNHLIAHDGELLIEGLPSATFVDSPSLSPRQYPSTCLVIIFSTVSEIGRRNHILEITELTIVTFITLVWKALCILAADTVEAGPDRTILSKACLLTLNRANTNTCPTFWAYCLTECLF